VPSRSTGGRCALVAAVGACALAAPPAASAEQPGGTAAPGGGSVYVTKPHLRKVSCIRRCASRRRARGGSTLKVTGTDLGSVKQVVFHGSYGRDDDVIVRVRVGSTRRLHVRVPMGAVSGPISVRVSRALRSRRSRSIAILPGPPPDPNPSLSAVPGPRQAGAPGIETGTSRTKAYYGARRAVKFSYRLSGGPASNARVELVRARDGAVVRTWSPLAAPGQVGTIAWNGKLGRAAAPQGRYAFRLTAQSASGAVARSSQVSDYQRDAFDLYPNLFPIRGRHSYGGAGGRFGAGRGGRGHQGQDVFARCGKRLVAARGGRVQYSGYQGSAGYYVVIDASGTRVDYGYMHLAERSPFRKSDRVYTGQRIGAVGDTGNAHGCHLHFELWRGGWYEGGRAFDPLPALRAWDSWS
jgi:murein DD-endopeptidase MepM/ murein hydrolase activator NlpD